MPALLDEPVVRFPIVFAFPSFDPFPGEILAAPFDSDFPHRGEPWLEIGRIGIEGGVDAKR